MTEATPVEIHTEQISLGDFLKWAAVVPSGGQAKWLISEGLVDVNGQAVTSRGHKLQPGDLVTVHDLGTFQVVSRPGGPADDVG